MPFYPYPLFLGLAIGVALNEFHKKLKLSSYSLPVRPSLFYFSILFIFFIFSKLLFLFSLYSLELSEKLIKDSNFWLGGGFVFYGGAIGIILLIFFWKKQNPNHSLEYLGPLATSLCLGHAIGRLGCFFAPCCFGAPLDHTHLFSVFQQGEWRHPVQLYESFLLFILWYFLTFIEEKFNLKGIKIFFLYLFLYSFLRFFLEFFRGDFIRGTLFIFSTSQFIALLIFTFSLFYYFFYMIQYLDSRKK